jgi:hypothetical protein
MVVQIENLVTSGTFSLDGAAERATLAQVSQ